MASYTISLSCSKSWEGYIDVTTTDDSANNRTYIQCYMYAKKTDGYASGSNGACFQPSITIDGETFWGTYYTTEYTSYNQRASASKYVSHSSSTGAKTVTISGAITKVSGSPSTALDGTTLSGSRSITLTTYTVTETYDIYYNPGTYGSPSTTYSSTKTEGIALTLSGALYTRSGYSQTGWASNAAGTSWAYSLQGSYTADSGTTLYPYWSASSYTITYSPGTYGSGSSTTQTKYYNTDLTLSSALYTRTGYTQIGWASDAAGTIYVYGLSGTYSNNSGTTLYPYWEPNVYTLTINPNSGSMWNGDSKTSSSFTTEFAYNTKTYMGNLTSSSTFYPDNTPTRTGYTFNTFSFSNGTGQKNTAGNTFYFMGEHAGAAGGTSNTTTTWIFNGDYAGNVTATASWTGNTYYVQYNANGGSGSMSKSTHTYGTAKALTANAFTKTNYTFAGWNTAEDGSGTSYSNQQSVSTLTSTAGATVQLYAQWSQTSYTVVFNMNGGSYTSGSFDNMVCTRGVDYTLPTGTIVKENYTFKGWSTSSTATSATYANGATINNIGSAGSTVTLYAVWTAKTFTIKYNANNGGTSYKSISYDATSAINTLEALPSTWTKSGYVANGWAKSSTATQPDFLFSQNFIGDLGVADGSTLNVYVVWTEEQSWSLALLDIYIKNNGAFVHF